MSNGLLSIAALIALALAALFAVPYFIDWNGYRGVFEEEATRVLGRPVRVGGNVNVRLLPAPFVSFDKLRIADTSGATGEPFFSADSFTMRLSVPPLLKGIIEANEIELTRPTLRLALDAQGGGNWRSLSIAPGMLPFVPADVTLQSVKIKDGVVAFHGPKGTGFAEFDGLNGELKAESIDGPFSFKGVAKWQGADREIRIATGAVDATGSLRFKATIRGENVANVYTVDGRIVDLKGQPHIEGDVTAKLELDPAQMPSAQQVPSEKTAADGDGKHSSTEPPLIDFKARLAGDAKGLRLDDITLSFERVGQPQLITGAATASWSETLSVDLDLGSRWLDLDRIAGSGDGRTPFDTARSFVLAVLQALPPNADTKVRFNLDQANLGGEPVSAIRIEVARSGGALLLQDLRAGLPGGTKLALDGTVADAPNARAFQGEFALRGTSLDRFLAWASKDKSLAETVGRGGPFSLQGRLGMSDKAIDLTEAGAEIGGMPFTGAMHYSRGERTRLALELEGQEIDGGQLWPAGVGYLKALLVSEEPAAAERDAQPPTALRRWLDPATSDLALRIKTGQLLTGRQPLRDVDLDLAIEQGRLAMRSCNFATDDGLKVEIEGDIADTDGQPRGVLHWVFSAPDKSAYATFLQLVDLPDDLSEPAMRYAALAPMHLAGSLRLGERSKTAADILADGSIQGGRMVAVARLDGGLSRWRDGGADLALTIDSPDVVRAVEALAARPSAASAALPELPGEVFIKAIGTPSSGLLAAASVRASGLFFAYDGRVVLPADGNHKLDGDVRVSARELGDVMALAGLGSGGAFRGVPAIGTAKLVSADHAIELKPQQLTVSGAKVDGSVALAYPDGGPAIVTAQLDVDQASIPQLLSVVLDRSKTVEAQAEPLTQGKTIWPEASFDFAGLEGIEGKLGMGFKTLALAPGMDIKDARLEVTLAPGKVSVSRLEGKALGGGVLVAFALERAPGGANLAADVRLTDVHLNAPAAGATGPATDATASLMLELSGRGATPGGLIAVATGKGEIALGDATMHVPTPLAVVATSEAALNGSAGASGDALAEALRAQIAASAIKVGPRKIAIEVVDGAAKLAPFTLPSPAGTTKVETTLDLASLVVDSTWVLEPKAPDTEQPDRPRKGALPSISVVYVGPLQNAWTLEPRITADQLERELAIRKMELDAEQLEQLHRLDAERARQEEERRQAPAADQPGPTTTAPAPGPTSPQSATPAPSVTPEPTPPVHGSINEWNPTEQVLTDPAVPAELPSEASGAGVLVPPGPGEVGPATPVQPGDAAIGEAAPAAPPGPDAAAPPPQDTIYKPRRAVRRQVPVGEQVLRALQNSTN